MFSQFYFYVGIMVLNRYEGRFEAFYVDYNPNARRFGAISLRRWK